MTMPETAAEAKQHQRDPQSFTPGDVLAWKVVAYTATGLTVAGTAAAIVAVMVAAQG